MAKRPTPRIREAMKKVYSKRGNYRRQLLLDRMTFYVMPVKAAFLKFYADHLGYEGYSNYILDLVNREYEAFKESNPKAHDAFIASLHPRILNPASEPINIPIPLKPVFKSSKKRTRKSFKIKVKKGLNPISSALSDSTSTPKIPKKQNDSSTNGGTQNNTGN